jgi:hypothetical protein
MNWIEQNGVRLLAGAAALCLVLAIVTMTMCSHQRSSTAVTKAVQRNDAAKDQAAIERRTDDATISNQQQEQNNVIDAAPRGETGPATRALNCDRWMRQHPGQARPTGC